MIIAFSHRPGELFAQLAGRVRHRLELEVPAGARLAIAPEEVALVDLRHPPRHQVAEELRAHHQVHGPEHRGPLQVAVHLEEIADLVQQLFVSYARKIAAAEPVELPSGFGETGVGAVLRP